MAKKLIWKGSKGNATVKVYWDRDWQEYCARLWCGSVERKNADFCASDKGDAIDTAQAMLEHNDCGSSLGCTCGRKRR